MSNFSSTYPSQRPVFALDAANAGRLDPRMTFSRSDTASSGDWNASTNAPGLADGSGTANQYYRVSVAGTQDLGSGSITYAVGDYVKYSGSVWFKTTQPIGVTYWSNEKHLSSDNLFTHSSTFDNAAWLGTGITKTSGQTDPAGGSNGYTFVEDTTGTYHNAYQNVSGNESWALTVYGKQNTGTRYLQLRLYGGSANNYETAVFDLAGSAPSTASGSSSGFTNVSATQTASGNGFYKCTLKGTGSITFGALHISQNSTATGLDAYGYAAYTGDNTSSIDVAFASLSTTGATDYNATTTQIHREYAPTLKYVTPATGGQPRFEYDPATNVSLGCLIESQAANLSPNSEHFPNWTATRVQVESNVAIGPDGTLSADRLVEDTSELGSNSHYIQENFTTTNGTQYTMSVYAKHGGGANRYCQLRVMGVGSGFAFANFDLTNGTYVGGGGSIRDSYSISSVGNGWHRLTMTFTNNSSGGTVNGMGIVLAAANSEMHQYTSDDFSGILLYGAQCETGSFGSSLVSTSGASATRAADSLSMPIADTGYTGGPVSVVGEAAANETLGSTCRIAHMQTDSNNMVSVYVSGGEDLRTFVKSDGTNYVDRITKLDVVDGQFYKFGLSLDTDNFNDAADGSSGTTDTSVVIPDLSAATLYLGKDSSSNHLNGHIKRVAVYGQSLSSSELAAITS